MTESRSQPYTKDDLKHGELVARELHGLKGFDAWAERIAKAIAIARCEERGTIEAEQREVASR